MPLYFRPLSERVDNPLEILAHRIVWSLVFLALILTLAGRWRDLVVCLHPSLLFALLLSALLIAANWYVYLLCVAGERITHASLGYFLTPLVSVLLGMIVFRERLRPCNGWRWAWRWPASAACLWRPTTCPGSA